MQSANKKLPYSRKPSISSDGAHSRLDMTMIHQQHELSRAELEMFNSRFSELYNQAQEDDKQSGDKMFFNFMSWEVEKNKNMKYDPQVLSSKLKQLENKLQLGRANMQLDKRHSPRKMKVKKFHVEESPHYLELYNRGQYKKPVFDEIPQNMDDSEDEDEKQKQQNDPSILYFTELKKRPKFLGYLINRTRQPTPPKPVVTFHNTTNINPQEYKKAFDKLERNRAGPNPQEIIEKQYPKFFNRVANTSLSQEIRDKPICKKIIEVQDHLIDGSPEISDENRRKLQQKLNHIVKEISKTDRHDPSRLRRNSTKLPRIDHD